MTTLAPRRSRIRSRDQMIELVEAPQIRLSDEQLEVLSNGTIAVRIFKSNPTQRVGFTTNQKETTAQVFDADAGSIFASTRLLDLNHPAIKKVRKARGKIERLHKDRTLPYPEPGIRLIKRDKLQRFRDELEPMMEELNAANEELQRAHSEILAMSRAKANRLFREDKFPLNLRHLVILDYPSIQVDKHLQELAPDIYARERAAAEARLQESITMFETELIEAFLVISQRLSENLNGVQGAKSLLRKLQDEDLPVIKIDGEGESCQLVFEESATPAQKARANAIKADFEWKPKTLRDDAVKPALEFFERFKALNVGANRQLEELIVRTEEMITGRIGAEGTAEALASRLRTHSDERADLGNVMSEVAGQLETMMEARPIRRMIRGGVRIE